LAKNIGAKAVRKMLMKLPTSRVERSIGEAEEKEVNDKKPDFWVKIRY